VAVARQLLLTLPPLLLPSLLWQQQGQVMLQE
jgi:hypothetical protein